MEEAGAVEDEDDERTADVDRERRAERPSASELKRSMVVSIREKTANPVGCETRSAHIVPIVCCLFRVFAFVFFRVSLFELLVEVFTCVGAVLRKLPHISPSLKPPLSRPHLFTRHPFHHPSSLF